jgi:hypothetical protein
VTVLQVLQGIFMPLDGGLELLDIFSAALAEGSLSLSVALLALFGGGIDRLAAALTLLLLGML